MSIWEAHAPLPSLRIDRPNPGWGIGNNNGGLLLE